MSFWSSQASKKASNKRQRGAQKSCSNVFSMFEQSQIQEFKEVHSLYCSLSGSYRTQDTLFNLSWGKLTQETAYLILHFVVFLSDMMMNGFSSLYAINALLLYTRTEQIMWSRILSHRLLAALTKTEMELSKNRTWRRPMHSWVIHYSEYLYLQHKSTTCNTLTLSRWMKLCPPGKLNVKDEELDEMLNEGKGPINFTVFLTLFGEKLNGGNLQLKQVVECLMTNSPVTLDHVCLPSGTDPEDTILAAFKLFDPNGTGFVNKDEWDEFYWLAFIFSTVRVTLLSHIILSSSSRFRRLLMNQADKFTAEEVCVFCFRNYSAHCRLTQCWFINL